MNFREMYLKNYCTLNTIVIFFFINMNQKVFEFILSEKFLFFIQN